MPDALEELESLVDTLPDIVRARRAGDAVHSVATEKQKADPFIGVLETLIEAVPFVVGHGVDRNALARRMRELAASGDDIARAEEAEELAELRHVFRDIPSRVNDTETQLRTAWQALVNAEFSPAHKLGQFLQQSLRDDAHSRALGEELAATARAAFALSFPPSPAGRAKLGTLRQTRESLRERMRTVGIQPALEALLLKLIDGRATLDDVTPALLDDLRQLRAASLIRLLL